MDAAVERQASDVLLLDLAGRATFADYFVIATCLNPRHMNAVAESLDETMSLVDIDCLHKEGTPDSGWILLDFSDVIVHLFTDEVRQRYGLEQLWSAAPTVLRIQ